MLVLKRLINGKVFYQLPCTDCEDKIWIDKEGLKKGVICMKCKTKTILKRKQKRSVPKKLIPNFLTKLKAYKDDTLKKLKSYTSSLLD